jgi:archaellum component FlaC
MGKDTICRIEENKRPKIGAMEFINDVFNPLEKLEGYRIGYDEKINNIENVIRELNRKFDSLQLSLDAGADLQKKNIRS